MRLIRSASRRVNIGFSHQLRPRQVILNEASNESLNQEVFRIYNGCNTWWPGRSYAASVTSDVPQRKNDLKKLSRRERRSLVEDFVNKYRAMHGWKFPTSSETRKNIGGLSHYVVKDILEELKYNYEIQQSSISVPEIEARIPVNDKPIGINLADETKEALHPDPDVNIKHEIPPEDKVIFGETAKAERQQSTVSPVSERESDSISSKKEQDQSTLVLPLLQYLLTGSSYVIWV